MGNLFTTGQLAVRLEGSPVDLADEYFTTPQLADRIHVAPISLAIWRTQGKGPRFCRAGRRILYAARDVAVWLDANSRQCTRDIPVSTPQAATSKPAA